jgi:hypothetical protein
VSAPAAVIFLARRVRELAIALQSVGTSWTVFMSWLVGTAAGAYAGVALAIRAHARIVVTS